MTRSGGTLFVVATPIGNLGDITLRAIETLRGAARVVAEDTRRTRALLTHLGIQGKPIDRLDAHASEADIDR
ncbi:MAG TPA: SAM-dependent methyltransferase, partial [Polyangiaceae bacterium]|nr:SAM-dependent methyltransferase [Polyangiaceae bacterium]